MEMEVHQLSESLPMAMVMIHNLSPFSLLLKLEYEKGEMGAGMDVDVRSARDCRRGESGGEGV